MTDNLFTIKDFVQAEIVEKKSRFISQIKHVETEKQALDFITEIKKKHSQARHNVYAYIIKGLQGECERIRFTDDGEPSQTAGKPTLEVLQHENLSNVACVVTRYFGGTLLGTGGLVRAYSGAVKASIEKAESCGQFEEIIEYKTLSEKCSYSDYESVKRKIENQSGIIDQVTYLENVEVTYRLPKN